MHLDLALATLLISGDASISEENGRIVMTVLSLTILLNREGCDGGI